MILICGVLIRPKQRAGKIEKDAERATFTLAKLSHDSRASVVRREIGALWVEVAERKSPYKIRILVSREGWAAAVAVTVFLGLCSAVWALSGEVFRPLAGDGNSRSESRNRKIGILKDLLLLLLDPDSLAIGKRAAFFCSFPVPLSIHLFRDSCCGCCNGGAADGAG